jgi:HK97 family phage portal protein
MAVTPGPADDFWYEPIGPMAASGVRVTKETALRQSAVYACVNVHAQSMAQIPLITYRRLANGGRDRATNHPLYELLHDAPNRWMTSYDWREIGQRSRLLTGNFFCQIVPGQRGFADQLIPLHPDHMQKVEMGEDGRIRYHYREHRVDGTQRDRFFLDDEVLSIPLNSMDGITGQSVISFARETVGLGLASEQYSARLFSQKPMMGGVLETDRVLEEDVANRVKTSWQESYSGVSNFHKVAVLESGLKWKAMGMTNEDAQFLELRKFTVEETVRFFRVPQHMIGDLDRATFNNIEHLSLEFVIHTLMPQAAQWEQRLSKSLIAEKRTYFVEFLMDGLLRGDAKTRAEVHQIMKRNGAINSDEWRQRENMNPIPDGGGEEYIREANLVPSGTEPQPGRGTQALDDSGVRSMQERAQYLALAAAMRVVRKEQHAAAKLEGEEAITAFFAGHAQYVQMAIGCSASEATDYAEVQRGIVLGGRQINETEAINRLASLALEERAA